MPGLIVLCSFISPFRGGAADGARAWSSRGEFIEVFVDTPIEDCIARDPKGLYAKAKAGEIKNFTGIDRPYEAPDHSDIQLNTVGQTPEQSAAMVLAYLRELGLGA